MVASVVVDAGFLGALLRRRDGNHRWAEAQSPRFPRPWRPCEAALSEAFHLLGERGTRGLAEVLRRRAVVAGFGLDAEMDNVLALMRKFANVSMSLADACLVRMSEVLAGPVLLTTDRDSRIYRRHSRLAVPCVLPS